MIELIQAMNNGYIGRLHGGNSNIFENQVKILKCYAGNIGEENFFVEAAYFPEGENLDYENREELVSVLAGMSEVNNLNEGNKRVI